MAGTPEETLAAAGQVGGEAGAERLDLAAELPAFLDTEKVEVKTRDDESRIDIFSVVEIGSVKPGMIPTVLEGETLERIHEYLSRDTRNEQGGCVIFHVETDPILKRRVARVKDFIPSQLGQATGVSFQWVSDDFKEAHQYADRKWPGSMIGFIHSHPGMSVGPTGETLDSFILKGFCREPFIPFLIYNPINRTVNDLRWDARRDQAVSVGGILIDQAGLSQKVELQFVDTDFFGGPGRGYKTTLVPSGKSLEESIEISGVAPAAAIVREERAGAEAAEQIGEEKSWGWVALEMAGNDYAAAGFEGTQNEIVGAAAFEFRREIADGTMTGEMFKAMMVEINGIAKSYEGQLGRPGQQLLSWPEVAQEMAETNIAKAAFENTGSRVVAAAAYRFREGISKSQDQGVGFKKMMKEINGVVGRYRDGTGQRL